MCWHGTSNLALTNIDQGVVYGIFQIHYSSNYTLTNKSNLNNNHFYQVSISLQEMAGV